MGADLGDGRVAGDRLICPFHHWEFGSDGRCVELPSGADPPRGARTFSYPVTERYGAVWVFNGETPLFPLPSFPNEERLFFLPSASWKLDCHHHLIISNGIDLNHWRCVHGFTPRQEPELTMSPDGRFEVRLSLTLERPRRLFRFVGARGIEATYTLLGGNLALIESTEPWPLHVMLAHRPIGQGRTSTHMFAAFPKGARWSYVSGIDAVTGIFRLALMGLLLMDDKEILNHLTFWPRLTAEDAVMAKFIQQVNGMPVFDARRHTWT